MFIGYKRKYVTIEEMNQLLEDCEYRRIIYGKKDNSSIGNKAFIEDKEVKFLLTYKKGRDVCTYITRKDCAQDTIVDGGEAYRILSLYYKVPHMPEELCGKYINGGKSASPWLYKNPKYDGTRNQAYSYDLNSAYSYGMIQKMPDTSVQWREGEIVKGKEIGFWEIPKPHDPDELMLVPKFEGYSKYIFPLIDSPFIRFVENWYAKKLEVETKAKAKNVLNSSIGYLQRVNPFLRATIIGYCNEFIKSKMDNNTLYCNTDSLVSLTRRYDLEENMGTGLGQWKNDHTGLFAYKGFNYQWDYEVPSYRGVAKSWFPQGWDILKDELPVEGNLYVYNKETMRLEERKR